MGDRLMGMVSGQWQVLFSNQEWSGIRGMLSRDYVKWWLSRLSASGVVMGLTVLDCTGDASWIKCVARLASSWDSQLGWGGVSEHGGRMVPL